MNRSDQIDELAAALAKAQGQMTGAKKDSTNPFFKSKYADLAAVVEAIRIPFASNGLAYTQAPAAVDGEWISMETMLMHSSGQWISSTLLVPVSKHDAQGYGSALTYSRRYGLQAIAGVPAEDDDGNDAVRTTETYEQLKDRRITELKQQSEEKKLIAKEKKEMLPCLPQQTNGELPPETIEEIRAKIHSALRRLVTAARIRGDQGDPKMIAEILIHDASLFEKDGEFSFTFAEIDTVKNKKWLKITQKRLEKLFDESETKERSLNEPESQNTPTKVDPNRA